MAAQSGPSITRPRLTVDEQVDLVLNLTCMVRRLEGLLAAADERRFDAHNGVRLSELDQADLDSMPVLGVQLQASDLRDFHLAQEKCADFSEIANDLANGSAPQRPELRFAALYERGKVEFH